MQRVFGSICSVFVRPSVCSHSFGVFKVQNLEVLSQFAETMEYVFNAKKRAIRQTMWTVFQAFCLGMVLMNFIVSCRNPLQSSLQPT